MPSSTPLEVTPTVHCHEQGLIDAAKPHPNKKKIFVFCDGTGNKFSARRGDKNANSNVVKLYTTVRIANDQVAYYNPGVGTMGDPSIRWAVLRFWSKVKGLAFGAGFKANVMDAYRYLMETYNDGDEIYIFGFSRGAYTARALAGMLHGYGLLCRGNERHIQYVWNMFRKRVDRQRDVLKTPAKARDAAAGHSITHNFAFAETFSRKVHVRFMGLWDTVSSVGWIYKPVRLLDMAQNPCIQVGRHAVSIDERRAFYRDNLWGEPVDINHPEWPDELRERDIRQDLAQVWFPGAHSDVGGSYRQTESSPANESLRWMIGEVQNNGVELCEERVKMVLGQKSGDYAADGIFTPPAATDHCLHDQLKDCKWWWILQCFPQQYYDKEDAVIQFRVPYGTPRHIPEGAYIHGSAERRLRSTTHGEQQYRPLNLKLDHLTPLVGPVRDTTANLEGCFRFTNRKGLLPEPDSTAVRISKLVVGWFTFGLAITIFVYLVWCLAEVSLHIARPVVRFVSEEHLLRLTSRFMHWLWELIMH